MPTQQNNKPLGQEGEDLACDFLRANSYKIITRNFHSRFGEIDIIAEKENTLIFIEVKTRTNSSFGSPVEAVTPWKLVNIQKTAEYFCMQNPKLPKKLRIEVVSVDLSSDSPQISLIQAY